MPSKQAGNKASSRPAFTDIEAANAEIDRLDRAAKNAEARNSRAYIWELFSQSSISLAALIFPPIVMLGVAAIDGVNSWSGNPPLDTALSSTIANNSSQVWLVTAGAALQRATNNKNSDSSQDSPTSSPSVKKKSREEDED